MSAKKTICIIGVTGNQGGSVAQRFLQDDTYRVRGLTRNTSSAAAQALSYQGVEIVQADLDDVESLVTAFKGANVIFSVTNYWEPFFRPDCRQKALDSGISCRRYAYDVELQQGKNIVDAAAQVVDVLDDNGFIVSTLSHARKSSGGKFQELYHFDAKADVFPDYVEEKYPGLARKMSCVQTGYFMSSYKILPGAYFGKKTIDGKPHFEMTFPTSPDALVPQIAINADMGNFVYAVSKMPPGNSYMAYGTNCSWTEYMKLWSAVTGIPASYREITLEEFMQCIPDRETGRETGDMFLYATDPGYGGGDEKLLTAKDIHNSGIECPMTALEDWMKKEDWSSVLEK